MVGDQGARPKGENADSEQMDRITVALLWDTKELQFIPQGL
jgi:hypothetical protein